MRTRNVLSVENISDVFFQDRVPDSQADAFWYHGPTMTGYMFHARQKTAPHQVTVMSSMESAAYYGIIQNPDVMRQIDVDMTYRLKSPFPSIYDVYDIYEKTEIIPFKDKINALVYINSNCGALNNRNGIVESIQQAGVPLHAMGGCLHNTPFRGNSVPDAFRSYKVCIAIENSDSIDYVTEKPWNAFRGGCVPVYQGADNAAWDFFPANNSAIFVKKLSKY